MEAILDASAGAHAILGKSNGAVESLPHQRLLDVYAPDVRGAHEGK